MPKNGLPNWLHYSDFQASCHNIIRQPMSSLPEGFFPLGCAIKIFMHYFYMGTG
jgi:hypothetical protein